MRNFEKWIMNNRAYLYEERNANRNKEKQTAAK